MCDIVGDWQRALQFSQEQSYGIVTAMTGALVQRRPDRRRIWVDLPALLQKLDFANRIMYLDMLTYLPDDILVKVDRAVMDVSLESRVPFRARCIVELAWKLPLAIKICAAQGK